VDESLKISNRISNDLEMVAQTFDQIHKEGVQLDDTIKKYSESFEYKDHQDLFAMVALQNTTKTVRLEAERSFKYKEMEAKLRELDEILTSAWTWHKSHPDGYNDKDPDDTL
jgi:cell division protein ZapA (FtsZ GTPase activity inhibitor)